MLIQEAIPFEIKKQLFFARYRTIGGTMRRWQWSYKKMNFIVLKLPTIQKRHDWEEQLSKDQLAANSATKWYFKPKIGTFFYDHINILWNISRILIGSKTILHVVKVYGWWNQSIISVFLDPRFFQFRGIFGLKIRCACNVCHDTTVQNSDPYL